MSNLNDVALQIANRYIELQYTELYFTYGTALGLVILCMIGFYLIARSLD